MASLRLRAGFVRRGLVAGLLFAAILGGGVGCRWKPAQSYVVAPGATTDPTAVYQTVQGVFAQKRYRLVQQDPSRRQFRVYAHVDETETGNSTFISIQVADNGIVQLVPTGALVSEGQIHSSLDSELVSLRTDIAQRLGAPAGNGPVMIATAPYVTPPPGPGMMTVGTVPAAPAAAQNLVSTPAAVAPGAIVRGDAQRNAFALVVGIERYRDAPAAVGARADADDFARVAEITLGVPPAQIHKIFDDRATKADIEGELEWIKLNVPKGGRVYFYYSGHGAPGAKPNAGARIETPYIVPYDARANSLARTGIALDQALEVLKRSAAKEVFAFLDSCFSGKDGFRSGPSAGARPLVPVELTTPASTVVYSAARADQVAGPDLSGQRGVFSKYLVQALGSARAEYNGDRNITFKELIDWMNNRVVAESKQANRVQEPSVSVQRGSESLVNDAILAYGVSAE